MQQQLKELEVKPNRIAFQAAIAFSVYYLVLIYLLKFLDIDPMQQDMGFAAKTIIWILSYVPFILAVIFVQNKHKTDLGGYMSFGRGFSAGFKMSAYAGLFLFMLILLYYKVLDPGAMAHMLDVAVDQVGEDESKIKAVKMMAPYMALFAAFGIAITYTLFGLIVSLAGAAVLKKELPADNVPTDFTAS